MTRDYLYMYLIVNANNFELTNYRFCKNVVEYPLRDPLNTCRSYDIVIMLTRSTVHKTNFQIANHIL